MFNSFAAKKSPLIPLYFCPDTSDVKQFLKQRRIQHIHGAPYHPMTQGKIERWHRSMKKVVKLQNYYTPSELQRAIAEWVEYYNNQRYHEALENVTPADVYFGRAKEIIKKRNMLKEQTLALRLQSSYNLRVYNPINQPKSLHKESAPGV